MTNHQIDVWINNAAPAGSGRYYALLHTEHRSHTGAVLALLSIWGKLCFSNKEIDAARKQLEWWQNELERKQPLHPVTAALCAENSDKYKYTAEQLKLVLQGYGSLLTDGSPSRAEPASIFHHRTGAVAAAVIAGVDVQQSIPANLHNIGVALSKFRCIRHVHKHTANGLLCLSFEEMSRANISPTDLVPGHYPEALETFLMHQLSAIDKEFESYFNAAENRLENQFLFVYARLQQKLLKGYQTQINRLDDSQFRLAPLSNFWHAWRAQRQLNKK